MNTDKEFMTNEQKQSDWGFYIEEFRSEECFCGREKRPKHSFCFSCYKKLPKEMQRALWRHFGRGYEQAYEAAHEYLRNLS